MSRAVVLSGGGPVGIGWETGFLFGLATKDVDLTEADAVIGTSAGAVVGARVALGDELLALIERHRREATARRQSDPSRRHERRGGMAAGLQALMETLSHASTSCETRQEVRARLGSFALGARTAPEERFLASFSELAGRGWPAGFSCTAVDALTGELAVWDASSGVDLDRAVASSCAVPGIYPPITVAGRRYIDGGMRSSTNADLAASHDKVVVVSVMPTAPPDHQDAAELAPAWQIDPELCELVRSGVAVELIGPGEELLTISGAGMHLMDQSRVPDAVEAGIRQGQEEAFRVQRFWEE